MVEPFVIGICGGSASGKTTVAQKIITELGVPWVTLLSMDSFYIVLSQEQHEAAGRNEHNFDHPGARFNRINNIKLKIVLEITLGKFG